MKNISTKIRPLILLFALLTATAPYVSAQKPGNTTYTVDAWYKADEVNATLPANGAAVTQWLDKSGNGYNLNKYASQSTPSMKYGGYNFHAALNFPDNGNAKLYAGSNVYRLYNNQAYYIFIVSRQSQRNSWNTLLSFYNFNGYYDVQWGNGTGATAIFRLNWATTARAAAGITLTAGDKTYGLMAISNTNLGNTTALDMYLNGHQSTYHTMTAPTASDATWNTYGTILVGNSYYIGSYNPFRGDIEEIVILRNTSQTAISAAELAKMQSYLAIKYGLPLHTTSSATGQCQDYVASDGTTKVWTAANHVNYGYNVFGIGRDDNSTLYQKQAISTENKLLTVFVGSSLTTLNSQNTGSLDNGDYLLFGSNGLSNGTPYDYPAGTAFSNMSIEPDKDLNYRIQTIYSPQLTGKTQFNVNFKVGNTEMKYLLISANPAFPPSSTSLYPIINGIASGVPVTSGIYISVAGYATGPGGVNDGLKLWLKADDENAVDISELPGDDSNLAGNPISTSADDIVPAIMTWKDPSRGHTYTFTDINANHRMPIYESREALMNYHPTIRFYGATSGTQTGAYLVNSSGLLSTAQPTDMKSTAFFMANNNFSANDWCYMMGFSTAPTGYIPAPAYGVQRLSNGNVVGRFRTTGTEATGTVHLFNAGSTSLLSYSTHTTSGNTAQVTFNVNGVKDATTFNSTSINLNRLSTVGMHYALDRQIQGVMSEILYYDRELTDDEMIRVQSYMALKYGLTLRISTNTNRKFDYKLSDGTIIWPGESDPSYGTYHNNVAAIIRDDAAGLLNNQSHSTEFNSILRMGVAGSMMGVTESREDIGEITNDKDVIIWGDNGDATINTNAAELNAICGSLTHLSNRIFKIRKLTNDNNFTVLISPVNDSYLGSALPVSSSTDVMMLVAETEADAQNNIFSHVIPLTWIDGAHQISYVLSKELTYVKFAWIDRNTGCLATDFTSPKTLSFKSWPANATTFAFDLGENVQGTATVTYDAGVTRPALYPRGRSNGYLQINRRGGLAATAKVTLEITTLVPVIPSFVIGDLDTYARAFDRVVVTGDCDGAGVTTDFNYLHQQERPGKCYIQERSEKNPHRMDNQRRYIAYARVVYFPDFVPSVYASSARK